MAAAWKGFALSAFAFHAALLIFNSDYKTRLTQNGHNLMTLSIADTDKIPGLRKEDFMW